MSGVAEGKPTLAGLKKRLHQFDYVSDELAEQAFRYQAARLKEVSRNDWARGLLDSEDLVLLDGEYSHFDVDVETALLPRWVRDYLRNYWVPLFPLYEVRLRNLSAWSHDFVVAYETRSGLVTIVDASVGPWGSDFVRLAPCWDMYSLAISVWNPDDNVEVRRTPTWTIEEIQRLGGQACSFTFEVEIEY